MKQFTIHNSKDGNICVGVVASNNCTNALLKFKKGKPSYNSYELMNLVGQMVLANPQGWGGVFYAREKGVKA